MATTADIKIGMCIELDGKTFQIVDFQHVKPGKGPAFVRTKLKNLENGRVLENTFSAGVLCLLGIITFCCNRISAKREVFRISSHCRITVSV